MLCSSLAKRKRGRRKEEKGRKRKRMKKGLVIVVPLSTKIHVTSFDVQVGHMTIA